MSSDFSVYEIAIGYNQMQLLPWDSAYLNGTTFLMKIIRFLAKPNLAMIN
jgi:hypothetical protein